MSSNNNTSPANMEAQPNTASAYNQELARAAILLSLGEDNQYLQKLLVNKLENIPKTYTSIPISELIANTDRTRLHLLLDSAVNAMQAKAVTALNEPVTQTNEPLKQFCVKPYHPSDLIDTASTQEQTSTTPSIDLGKCQSISSWVINTILQEKLNCREVHETSEKWKNINGILVVILPLITAVASGLIAHYLPSNNSC